MSATAFQLDVPFLAEADVEARALAHSYVAPEHLLLALAHHGTDSCRRFFEDVRLDAAAIREAVQVIVGTPGDVSIDANQTLRLSHRAQIAIAAAIDMAHARRHTETAYSADDLLHALLSDRVAAPAVVEAIFRRVGLTPADARGRLEAVAI